MTSATFSVATYSGGDEPDEYFFVELTAASGATVVAGHVGRQLGVCHSARRWAAAKRENISGFGTVNVGSSVNFLVTLSSPGSGPITVQYQTSFSDGGNTAYGSITIAAGVSTGFIPVTIPTPGQDETNDDFCVELTGASNAVVGAGNVASVFVQNSNAQPFVSISNAATVDGGASASFVATLSAPSDVAVTVYYQTVDGTATAGTNYNAKSGSATIGVGQTTSAPILVGTKDVADNAQDEVFLLELNAASGATVAGPVGFGVIACDAPVVVAASPATSPTSLTAGTSFSLDFSVTNRSASELNEYTVNWGDGSQATTVAISSTSTSAPYTPTAPTHTYSQGGDYTIAIRARDNSGDSGTATVAVTVADIAPTAPAIDSSLVPTSPVAGTPITLIASDPIYQDTYTWTVTLNGGSTSYTTGTGTSFTFTPDETGSYRVKLTAANTEGYASTTAPAIIVGGVNPSLSISGMTADESGGTITVAAGTPLAFRPT